MFDLTDATVAYVDALVGLFFVFGVAIIIYSLDDVVVDVIYWAMRISGTIRAERSQLSEQALLEQPQRPLAVMVPAWREEAVIYEMLKTNAVHSATTVFFVGAYPNDAATQREVLRAAAERPENVRLVIGPHDGPTTKADCLNAIIAEIGEYEKTANIKFEGFVLHDSEDVIHPLEFPLFSALIGTFDFIQIPVYSFRRTLLQMTAGTYMDEFAEFHNKDLFVRQRLTGVVPCAGVAACFSRRAIEALKSWRRGEVFDPVALTEDYDVAFAMKSLGLKSAFFSMRLSTRWIFRVGPIRCNGSQRRSRSRREKIFRATTEPPTASAHAGCWESGSREPRSSAGATRSPRGSFFYATARASCPASSPSSHISWRSTPLRSLFLEQ